MQVNAFHGVFESERSNMQKFEIDFEYSIDILKLENDEICNTIDYNEVYKRIEYIIKSNSFKLIETLAKYIIDDVITNYKIIYCKVNIRKPNAPINGKFDCVEIEMKYNE